MTHGRQEAKVHQGRGTKGDRVMVVVAGMDNMIRFGITMARLKLIHGLMLHRHGRPMGGIKCAGLTGSGAQAVSTGLTSSSTHGRRTRQVRMGGSSVRSSRMVS